MIDLSRTSLEGELSTILIEREVSQTELKIPRQRTLSSFELITENLDEFEKIAEEFNLYIKFLGDDIQNWQSFEKIISSFISQRESYLEQYMKDEKFQEFKKNNRQLLRRVMDEDFSKMVVPDIINLYQKFTTFEILFGNLRTVQLYKELKENLEIAKSLTDGQERYKACNEVLSYSQGFITGLRKRYEQRGFEPETEDTDIITGTKYFPKKRKSRN